MDLGRRFKTCGATGQALSGCVLQETEYSPQEQAVVGIPRCHEARASALAN